VISSKEYGINLLMFYLELNILFNELSFVEYVNKLVYSWRML